MTSERRDLRAKKSSLLYLGCEVNSNTFLFYQKWVIFQYYLVAVKKFTICMTKFRKILQNPRTAVSKILYEKLDTLHDCMQKLLLC